MCRFVIAIALLLSVSTQDIPAALTASAAVKQAAKGQRIPAKVEKKNSGLTREAPAASHGKVRVRHPVSVEAALEQTLEVQFTQRPLTEVAEFFAKALDIEIVLDRKALDYVAINPDMPVTFSCKRLPFHVILSLALKPLNLAWTVEDGVLLITTPETEEQMLSTRVYDVADLVVCRDTHNQPWEDYEPLKDLITWSCVRATKCIEKLPPYCETSAPWRRKRAAAATRRGAIRRPRQLAWCLELQFEDLRSQISD
ncbi:MAG: hypothetical protein ABSG68_19250 [Thermoguttaceae bacterium]